MWVLAVLGEYHDEVEVDCLTLGVDILDFWRGRVSARRMAAILRVKKDEPGSALNRALDPDQWTTETYMLRGIHHVLALANWQRGGDSNQPQPKALPLPGETQAKTEAIGAKARLLRERQRSREAGGG